MPKVRLGLWPGLGCDLRYSLRILFKDFTLASVAVLTLGIGIGAVTSIFAVVHSVLLQPLPFPRSDELVKVAAAYDVAQRVRSFRTVTAFAIDGAALLVRDQPGRVPAAYTTSSFARTLGVPPVVGRYFTDDEDGPGEVTVAVISDRLWRVAMKANPEVVGKRVLVDGVAVTIVGVMPAGFAYPQDDIDLWLPAGAGPVADGRAGRRFTVIARLAPGASLASARAETGAARPVVDSVVDSLKEDIVGPVRPTLWLLQAAVIFVLLIATANVSNLLLARAESRGREIAVRNALGADRPRLVRQFLSESIVLGGFGAVVGLVLAIWGVDLTVAILPAGAPRAGEIHIDGWVLAFGAGVALAISILPGLAPILHTRVDHLGAALKEGRRNARPPRPRVRQALVVSQIALAVVLVVGCGLVVESYLRLRRVDAGFRPDGLVTGHIDLPAKSYPRDEDVLAFFERVQRDLRAEPGVEAATLVSGLPPSRRLMANDAEIEGRADAPTIDYWQLAGDDLLATLGVRLVGGRWLGPDDGPDAPPVVVVNEAFARRFFSRSGSGSGSGSGPGPGPGASPIGRRLRIAPWLADAPWQTIVGVVADVKQQGVDMPAGTEVYVPLRQATRILGHAPRGLHVVIRGGRDADASALAAALRTDAARIDRTLPVDAVRSMDQVMADAVGRPRFLARVLATFAAVALILAAIGVYGVTSYSVARRTRELGIRIALGARATGVRRLVMAEGLALAGLGVVIGLAAAVAVNYGLAGAIACLLYDVRPVDPATFAGVAAIVLAVAALACFVPARRATRVDPTIALRHE